MKRDICKTWSPNMSREDSRKLTTWCPRTSKNEAQNPWKSSLGGLLGPLGALLGPLGRLLGSRSEKNFKKCVSSSSTWDPKSTKNRKKSMLKKHLFWDTFFSWIFFDFASILDPQNHHFGIKIGYKVKHVNFLKIVFPCRRELDFQGFEGSKINKKLQKKNQSKNESKK